MQSKLTSRRLFRFKRPPLLKPELCLLTLLIIGLFPETHYAWGPSAHRLVNSWAIETLPSRLRAFFNTHRQYLTEHASDSDLAVQENNDEWQHHYLFLDRYGRFPHANLPHVFQRAVQLHGSRKVNRNGILPWQIQEYSLNLTKAFQEGNWEAVRLYAAQLGHYVSDAHQPLHTSSNFDGKSSGQSGVANRYGSSLVDRYINFFIMDPEDSTKIDNPVERAFQIILESHTWVDNILLADLRARDGLMDYTDEYYDNLYSSISLTLMEQINAACHDVGSYWYTAWLNAGRPMLPPE